MIALRSLLSALLLIGLAACALPPMPGPEGAGTPGQDIPSRLDADRAARQFAEVVATVEPVAEGICRARRDDDRCAFRIAIDSRRRMPANAFQTLDADGQPVLIFTLALIADMRNPDELAFVMSHEASHHILDHLTRQRDYAAQGAQVYAEAAMRSGASRRAVRRASELGAAYGARSYSRQFELEADYLGAQIARAAGFDPLRGALYFDRLPDPGDDFLGSHPPNAERMATVRRALAAR
ncbi:M48 family metallopeptidase [Pseudooceanicola sp. 200-1SW]|uniref:M48 family metallopeptidase n=1 Tax=Pseudooceanicola sp. 200-1SW TaxID=3425949 RepID=UPI003D7FB346